MKEERAYHRLDETMYIDCIYVKRFDHVVLGRGGSCTLLSDGKTWLLGCNLILASNTIVRG